jgi:Xaa-Pro aminopeptidase
MPLTSERYAPLPRWSSGSTPYMSHAPSDSLKRRHQAIRTALRTRDLDALVVTALPNVLYLTNFTGSAGIVVLTADRLFFVTDFRYATAIAAARDTPYGCPDLEIVAVDGTYDATVATLLRSLSSRRVGFEAAHLPVSRYEWLIAELGRRGVAPLRLVSTEGLVERARVRKDDYETATLREAARRLAAVAMDVFGEVRAGRMEREVALAIEWRIRTSGFTKVAFDTIVAAGLNAALPHAQPGERTLTEGDLVVLDFGGIYDSYCVDLTRTVSVGRASARAREVYAAVLEAHDSAIAAVRPGASRFDVDAAARETLDRYALGEAFGHGTGHGLGIEVHEDPRIVRRRPEIDIRHEELAPGMVFTIEPGAYLPGWGGVRIEDDVLVTETGVEVLTDVTTELLEL